jgi:hypothetical protein
MAIKISGTTVIDDSRNIQNVGILTASTSATVGSAVTINASGINASTGIITASSFSGSGSGLSGVSTNFVAAIGIQSAGTVIGAGITQLNFIGTGNTFAVNGTTVNISIAGGSGTGGVTSLDITSNLFF